MKRIWEFINSRHKPVANRDEEALDQHAHLLLADDIERAAEWRRQQREDLAAIMELAEELALALRPVAVAPEVRERLWAELNLQAAEERTRRERITAVMRNHGKEMALGTAILGTAVSLGIGGVALYHRRRQGDTIPAANA